MIWTTWRQHRAEAAVAAALLAALAAAMLVVGSVARTRAHALGLPACTAAHGDCSSALAALHRDFHTIPPFIAALIAVPLLAGMFWAAPLVAREYEAGTHRLAWTQSVSPVRWITTKVALIFGVLGAAALLLGLLAVWTLAPLTDAFSGRYNTAWYETQGLVPVATMLFALAVGVAASALIRRTIPAMAIALVVYAAARIPMHWVRARFWPLSSKSSTAPMTNLLTHPLASVQQNFAASFAPGDWVQSTVVRAPSGGRVDPNLTNLTLLQRYCPGLPSRGRPPAAALQACQQRLTGLSLRETVSYQPASHFWLVQGVETGLFVLVALALAALAILTVARRR